MELDGLQHLFQPDPASDPEHLIEVKEENSDADRERFDDLSDDQSALNVPLLQNEIRTKPTEEPPSAPTWLPSYFTADLVVITDRMKEQARIASANKKQVEKRNLVLLASYA